MNEEFFASLPGFDPSALEKALRMRTYDETQMKLQIQLDKNRKRRCTGVFWLVIYLLEIAATVFLFTAYVGKLNFSKFDMISAQPDPLWMVCGSDSIMFSDPRSPNINQLADD